MAIFSKHAEDDGPKVIAAPTIGPSDPAQSPKVTVIGPTLVFKGELSADEDLVIEGQMEGTIAHHKKRLTVGEHGRVKADIHASAVTILGHLVGDIHSESVVTLAKGSDVTGNIFCSRIVMEDGARFRGQVDMGETASMTVVPKKARTAETVRDNSERVASGKN